MAAREIQELFDRLWEPYAQQNPQVPAIHELISAREKPEDFINDHIALRTFRHPRIGLAVLAKDFLQLGFEAKGEFHIPAKKVYARYYKHPSGNWPRVFISELCIEELSQAVQLKIHELISQISEGQFQTPQLSCAGKLWESSFDDFEMLRQESEYAAWMAAHGFQMNHATVSVNALKSFSSIEELNLFLGDNGYELNGADRNEALQIAHDDSGDVILKQSSTLAGQVSVKFSDGEQSAPGCYYEFIQRFKGYDSFDPGNASKIFESTDVKS